MRKQFWLLGQVYKLLSLRTKALIWVTAIFALVSASLEYVVLRDAGLVGTFALALMALFLFTVLSMASDRHRRY